MLHLSADSSPVSLFQSATVNFIFRWQSLLQLHPHFVLTSSLLHPHFILTSFQQAFSLQSSKCSGRVATGNRKKPKTHLERWGWHGGLIVEFVLSLTFFSCMFFSCIQFFFLLLFLSFHVQCFRSWLWFCWSPYWSVVLCSIFHWILNKADPSLVHTLVYRQTPKIMAGQAVRSGTFSLSSAIHS